MIRPINTVKRWWKIGEHPPDSKHSPDDSRAADRNGQPGNGQTGNGQASNGTPGIGHPGSASGASGDAGPKESRNEPAAKPAPRPADPPWLVTTDQLGAPRSL